MSATALTETILGAHVIARDRLHGGDLSKVDRLDLSDGRNVVSKQGAHVATEAVMLRAMAEAEAPVPRVLYQTGRLLILEWLRETPASTAGWQALGRGLATLHAAQGPDYGWPAPYAFGALSIDNERLQNWPDFWARRRLLPFVADLPKPLARRVERLAAALPDRLPRTPPPALLHGDLWTGNALFSGASAYLIDPACYYGDAEVDLAMLSLFGAVPDAFFEGYGPLASDAKDRRAIYQVWPALVHLSLFGPGYLGLVENRLRAAGV
ncbi:fructosamine kinase family protein [Primorskyibacter sp. 2E107]|uniref:fructosamine kinase family protein n=1 Tax=Primorskyibacter sp. 2E107 TaxID=3403458 RepID=UPI003AF78158